MMAEELVEKEKYKEKKLLSIASFVLGIIGIVSCLFYYITFPCSILAIIFGVIGIRKNEMKLAKAGLILGIIGVSLASMIYLSFISIITLVTY